MTTRIFNLPTALVGVVNFTCDVNLNTMNYSKEWLYFIYMSKIHS